jgi:hypothetical protein
VKYSKRDRPLLVRLLTAGLLAGTLAWELLERLLALTGLQLSLQTGPVGFDIEVLKVELMVNPGTFLGCIAAYIIFRRL